MSELNEKIKKAQDLTQNLQLFSHDVNKLTEAVEILEQLKRDESVYLNESSRIEVRIGCDKNIKKTIFETDNQRDVLDFMNLCEAICTKRVENILWGIKNVKKDIIKILQA